MLVSLNSRLAGCGSRFKPIWGAATRLSESLNSTLYPNIYDYMKKVNLIELSKEGLNTRRVVNKTVETYPYQWKVIYETLQNAKDAIQRSRKKSGEIQINMDLDDEKVKIRDNGRGFPFDLSLLGFGGGDKDPADFLLGGDIGVGISAIIISSNLFELEAVHMNRKWNCKIERAHEYLGGRKEDITIDYSDSIKSSADSYTFLQYSFPHPWVSQFIDELYWHYASLAFDKLASSNLDKFKMGLEHRFRTQSYAGDVNSLLGISQVKPVRISVTVSCGTKGIKKIKNEQLKQIFQENPSIEIDFPAKYWDAEEAIERTRKGKTTPVTISPEWREGGEIGDYNRNYVCIKKLTKRSEIMKLIWNSNLRDPIDTRHYKRLLNTISGIYLVMGTRENLRNYLIEPTHLIAASGVPSAHDIRKPSRGGLLGLLNNICLIVNLKAKLNYGKQTISDTSLVGYVFSFFEDAYRATIRDATRSIVGMPEEPAPSPRVTGPPTEVILRTNLELPLLSIMKEPLNETEVIALFYELIGKGILNEYKTYALLPRHPYDAKMILKYPGQKEFTIPKADDRIPNAEFKIRVSQLIGDFEEGDKKPNEIDLLIAWENDWGERGHRYYEVIDVVGTEIEDYLLPHVKTCLHHRPTGRIIQMLILKDMVEELKVKK